MKKTKILLGVLCAFMFVGCNGSANGVGNAVPGAQGGADAGHNPAGHSPDGYQSLGGCSNSDSKTCIEVAYIGTPPADTANHASSQFKNSCEQNHGAFSASCSAAQALGGCRIVRTEGSVTTSVTTIYYSGSEGAESAERVKQICAMMHGEFVSL